MLGTLAMMMFSREPTFFRGWLESHSHSYLTQVGRNLAKGTTSTGKKAFCLAGDASKLLWPYFKTNLASAIEKTTKHQTKTCQIEQIKNKLEKHQKKNVLEEIVPKNKNFLARNGPNESPLWTSKIAAAPAAFTHPNWWGTPGLVMPPACHRREAPAIEWNMVDVDIVIVT